MQSVAFLSLAGPEAGGTEGVRLQASCPEPPESPFGHSRHVSTQIFGHCKYCV